MVSPSSVCCLSGRRTHIVQACEFVQSIAPDERHANGTPELLMHDRKGTTFPVRVDERGHRQPVALLAAAMRANVFLFRGSC